MAMIQYLLSGIVEAGQRCCVSSSQADCSQSWKSWRTTKQILLLFQMNVFYETIEMVKERSAVSL